MPKLAWTYLISSPGLDTWLSKPIQGHVGK